MELKAVITKRGPVFDGKAPELAARKLTSAMYEAVMFLEVMVKKNLPTEVDGVEKGVGVFGNQGGLRGGIHGEVEKGFSVFSGMTGNKIIRGIVGHQSLYGDVIEKGREANGKMPPKGTLVRWMEVKLGMKTDEATKKEFALRRSIANKGFKGIHMFERALKDNFGAVREIFKRYGFEIAEAINR